MLNNIEKMFGMVFTDEFEKLVNEAFEQVEREEEKKEKEVEENNSSYCRCICDKYEGGRHVSHTDKIVKDGKVIKDVHNCIDCCKGNSQKKVEEKKEAVDCKDKEPVREDKTQFYEKKIKDLKKYYEDRIHESEAKYAALEHNYTKLEEEYTSKINSIKTLFA